MGELPVLFALADPLVTKRHPQSLRLEARTTDRQAYIFRTLGKVATKLALLEVKTSGTKSIQGCK